jgi:hypothetical protein
MTLPDKLRDGVSQKLRATYAFTWKQWLAGMVAAAWSGGINLAATVVIAPAAGVTHEWSETLRLAGLLFLIGAFKRMDRYMEETWHPGKPNRRAG